MSFDLNLVVGNGKCYFSAVDEILYWKLIVVAKSFTCIIYKPDLMYHHLAS